MPEYPSTRATVANVMPDFAAAELASKLDMPRNVLWTGMAGDGWAYTWLRRMRDGCIRKLIRQLLSEEARLALSLRVHRGKDAKHQIAFEFEVSEADPETGLLNHDGPLITLVDMPEVRYGLGDAHTLTIYTDPMVRLDWLNSAAPLQQEAMQIQPVRRIARQIDSSEEEWEHAQAVAEDNEKEDWQEAQEERQRSAVEERHEMAIEMSLDVDVDSAVSGCRR